MTPRERLTHLANLSVTGQWPPNGLEHALRARRVCRWRVRARHGKRWVRLYEYWTERAKGMVRQSAGLSPAGS